MINFETIRIRYLSGYITDVIMIGAVAKAYKNSDNVIVYEDSEGNEQVATTQLERYWKLGVITDSQYSDLFDEKHTESIAEDSSED